MSSNTTFTASYSNVSDTCTVTVEPSYLFYDDCSTDKSSNYTTMSNITITYNSAGYYEITNTVGDRTVTFTDIANVNARYSFEVQLKTHGGLLLSPNGSWATKSHLLNYNTNTKESEHLVNGGSGYRIVTNLDNTTWYTLQAEIVGTNITMKVYNGSTPLFSNTYSTTSGTLQKFGVMNAQIGTLNVRNIKVEAL